MTLVGLYARFEHHTGDTFGAVVINNYSATLSALSEPLQNSAYQTIISKMAGGTSLTALAEIPDDPAYKVFSTPYAVGNDD
jgi:hypothetical protein